MSRRRWGLTSGNVGFTRIFGGGVVGMLAGVVMAVVATAAAGFVFSWLRRRSGSLLAPIALHWSLNGLGPWPLRWYGTFPAEEPLDQEHRRPGDAAGAEIRQRPIRLAQWIFRSAAACFSCATWPPCR